MEELEKEITEELNIDNSLDNINSNEQNTEEFSNSTPESEKTESTAVIEYKEIDEPCVALTIIGENKLTDAQIFVKRGFKFSIKAFFSTLVLTIMNMFI